MRTFGLIGFPLEHSFSATYFEDKFRREKIDDAIYKLFPIQDISKLPEMLGNDKSLKGLNITIPYKIQILQYIDILSPEARHIGAVNTVKIDRAGSSIHLIGFNTDVVGFELSIKPLLKPWHRRALILGTGGGARAAAYFFEKAGIDFRFVSRNPVSENELPYSALWRDVMQEHTVIVNATPVGMYPKQHIAVNIPYQYLGENHLVFDMVYNPPKPLFLRYSEQQGAVVKNGLEMLHIQAEKSWKIWNSTK